MVQILVNKNPTTIGQPIPEEVVSLEIMFVNMGERFQKIEEPLIKKWFNDLIDACSCEWIEYNKCLMRVEDLTKFEL